MSNETVENKETITNINKQIELNNSSIDKQIELNNSSINNEKGLIVQTPNGVIYEFKPLPGQEDNSIPIDLLHSKNPYQADLKNLTQQLEEKNIAINEVRNELQNRLLDINNMVNSDSQITLSKEDISSLITTAQTELQNMINRNNKITLSTEAIYNLTTAELKMLNETIEILNNVSTIPVSYIEKLKLVDKLVKILICLKNDRNELISKLVVLQYKAFSFASENPQRVLSGDEIVSNYMFHDIYYG
jgi:small-conductance mechanosensitive channel